MVVGLAPCLSSSSSSSSCCCCRLLLLRVLGMPCRRHGPINDSTLKKGGWERGRGVGWYTGQITIPQTCPPLSHLILARCLIFAAGSIRLQQSSLMQSTEIDRSGSGAPASCHTNTGAGAVPFLNRFKPEHLFLAKLSRRSDFFGGQKGIEGVCSQASTRGKGGATPFLPPLLERVQREKRAAAAPSPSSACTWAME